MLNKIIGFFLKVINKKYLMLPVIFGIFILYSFTERRNKEKIYIEILNKDTITNGSIVEFKITNNSNKNYCFLIDTVTYKIKTPIPLESTQMRNNIFNLSNDKNEGIVFRFKDDSCEYNEEMIAFNKKMNYKKTINNLIKVKSKSSFTYKMKFNSNVFYDDYCWGKYILDEKSKYFLNIDINYYDIFFNKQMKDSICKSGYKLYTKKLSSQKVPFKIK